MGRRSVNSTGWPECLFSVIGSTRDSRLPAGPMTPACALTEVGHRLKGSNSGEHHLVREEARALRAWLKVRGSFPGPIFLSKQKRPIDRTTLPSVDEEVRRRGRHPRETAALSCVKALLRHAFIEQGFRRGAGPGLDWARDVNAAGTTP